MGPSAQPQTRLCQTHLLSQRFFTNVGQVYMVDFDAAIAGVPDTGANLQLEVQVSGNTTNLDQTVSPSVSGVAVHDTAAEVVVSAAVVSTAASPVGTAGAVVSTINGEVGRTGPGRLEGVRGV